MIKYTDQLKNLHTKHIYFFESPENCEQGWHRWAKTNRTCYSIDNSAMVTHRKACNMSKVLECCRRKGPNLHSKSFNYSLPNLPKSSLPLKLDICLLPCAQVHWTQKLTAKKSRFKFCKLFSVETLQQRAWSQNFSNWPAKTYANWMLGSADPEHIDSSDRSAA